MRVEGGGAVRGAAQQNLQPKPKAVEQQTAQQTREDGAAKVGAQQQTGNVTRARLERDLQRAENGNQSAQRLTPDEQARRAAQQVADTFNSHARPVDASRGSVASSGVSPQEAAARKLRELTDKQTPEVAALTVKYAKPTISRIAAELYKTQNREDGGYNVDKPRFDNVVNDLARVAQKAAQAPNGQEAVKTIAERLVNNIRQDGVGRFDEALGKTVANGAGAELSAAVIKQLKATNRTGEADDILQNVKDAVNDLHNRAKDINDKIGKYNEELGWLVRQWKPLMTDEQLGKAIQAYKDKHPEYVKGLQEIDRIAVSVVRAIDSYGNAEKDFANLGNADDVTNAFKKLFEDDATASLIAQSPAATAEINRLMDKADKNPNQPNFFANLGNIAGKIDNGKKLTEGVLGKMLDAAIEKSFQAAKSKDYAAVTKHLQQLERYAGKLGFDTPEFKAVLARLDKVNARVADATARGKDPLRAANGQMKELRRDLGRLKGSNPAIFGDDSAITRKFKGFGVALGAIAVSQSLPNAINDFNAENAARALSDAGGLLTDGAQVGIVKNLLQNKSWYSKLPLEGAGKFFGGLGVALDAFSALKSIKDGNYVDAGFSTASAAGGALAIFGASAAATGVGLVIVGAAIVGKVLWEKHKESVRHETDGARAFLQGAGINQNLANQLINNDDKGRSAAPVFNALANHLKVDPKRFFDYLSRLNSADAQRLIETAHGVDPDDKGVYPVSKDNGSGFLGTGLFADRSPNDLLDLIVWMKENGFANAPGLPR